MEDTIVLYPSPGIGHLVSMVELGKLFLTHYPSYFSITVLLSNPPFESAGTASYIAAVSAATPSITIHHLPAISTSLTSSAYDIPSLNFEFASHNNPNVRHALESISKSSNLKAFIIDFFCNPALQIGRDLKIPTYYFFTTSASNQASVLYFPTIHRTIPHSLKDVKGLPIDIPGVPTVRASEMPPVMNDRTKKIYESFLDLAIQMAKAAGLIINSFNMLEERAIKAIAGGKCVPDAPTPPIYCIGPLVSSGNKISGAETNKHECLKWLDSQPSRSVLFLSFGSIGLFTAKQLQEMAMGLEKSGARFLWVVRNPPTENGTLESFLPEGFPERTRDRGLLLKNWAPQVDVLNHESVGGFVTHCGWNSILEAVCAGVPMLAWPLYAEQKFNRVFLVKESRVALSLTESEDGFVSATEFEQRVTDLMSSEKGKEIRERVMALKDGAEEAIKEGGSSCVNLARLVETLKRS